MKKRIWTTNTVPAMICAVLLLAGCGKKETPEEPAASSPAATPAAALMQSLHTSPSSSRWSLGSTTIARRVWDPRIAKYTVRAAPVPRPAPRRPVPLLPTAPQRLPLPRSRLAQRPLPCGTMRFRAASWPKSGVAAKKSGVPLGNVKLLAPIPRPSKCLAAFVNYLDRPDRSVESLPNEYFFKAPELVGPEGIVELSDIPAVVVYQPEAELAFVTVFRFFPVFRERQRFDIHQ